MHIEQLNLNRLSSALHFSAGPKIKFCKKNKTVSINDVQMRGHTFILNREQNIKIIWDLSKFFNSLLIISVILFPT